MPGTHKERHFISPNHPSLGSLWQDRIQGFGSDAGGGGGGGYGSSGGGYGSGSTGGGGGGGRMVGFGSADVVQSGMQALSSGMRSLSRQQVRRGGWRAERLWCEVQSGKLHGHTLVNSLLCCPFASLAQHLCLPFSCVPLSVGWLFPAGQ